MILLPLIALALRPMGLRRTQRVFSCFALYHPVRKTERHEAAIARALHISRLVGLASRHGICEYNCLQQSLTLWWLLSRNGIRGKFHIGARKEAGWLNAHAWIEIEGLVLNDNSDVRRRYEPFDGDILL
jgi:hypothetical protein